jgi:5S rRNA maturation endonuclease (ribonuclease M5)
MLRGEARPGRVVIAEGITDYLAAAQFASRDGPGTAVLGGISGSFGALAQTAIPETATVYAWTDPDEAGDRYAAEIARALSGRDVRRVDTRRRA